MGAWLLDWQAKLSADIEAKLSVEMKVKLVAGSTIAD
jgi:hypothetical protein